MTLFPTIVHLIISCIILCIAAVSADQQPQPVAQPATSSPGTAPEAVNPVAQLLGMPAGPPPKRQELVDADFPRVNALNQVPAGTALRNTWESGMIMNVGVWISTSAELPIEHLSDLASAEPSVTPAEWQAHELVGGAGSSAGQEAQGSGGFSVLGSIGKGLMHVWHSATGAGSEQDGGADGASASPPTLPGRTADTAVHATMRETGATLLWWEQSWQYGELDDRRLFVNLTLPATVVERNQSLYAHVVISPGTMDARAGRWDEHPLAAPGWRHIVHALTEYAAPPKKDVRRSLLDGSPAGDDAAGDGADGPSAEADPEAAADDSVAAWIPWWTPLLAVTVLQDHTVLKAGSLPPLYSNSLAVCRAQGSRNNLLGYAPPAYINEFWLLRSKWMALNDTVTTVPLQITMAGTTLWKWQIQEQMSETWRAQAGMMGQSSSETDEIKRILLDTNPYFLGLTVVVSLLHMLFDFLAFKNEVSFYRSVKSMEGLSVRSMMMSTVFQVVIFLYLLDNDTSWMVLLSSGGGVAVELWKLRKALSLKLTWRGWLPQLSVQDKDEGYVQSRTRYYDDLAMAHMFWVIVPVILGYAGYSLVYDKYKSWWSWVLGCSTTAVYFAGFTQMLPQLYINARLKSVAHLPWLPLTYRFFSTIIDDLFAFIVEMPTLHRLACFRDDIVFVIFLYQRWIYPVDKTRVNEYGMSGEDYELAAARKRGEQRKPRRSKWDVRSREELGL